MILLGLLAAGLCAYWLVPRLIDGWTRDQAAAYLRSFTGASVGVGSASFSLFGGIELHGVSIDVAGSPARERFLQADTIVLRHRPWSLFSQGRLEPTEVVCIAPIVTLSYDAEKGRYTAEELIAAARRAKRTGRGGFQGPLPVISIRDVRVRLLSGETRLDISMVPSGQAYQITLEEQRAAGQEPLRGTWWLDLATGRLLLKESKIPKIAHTDGILPQQYAKWRQRYNIRGRVVLRGQAATAPGEAILDAELDNVSLQLQSAEGGLALAGVRGTLTFRQDEVIARGLTGRIPQAGDATFGMSGQYRGYDPNSPFDLELNVQGMVLPDGSGATGWLGDTVKFLHRTFQPTGKLDISASFRRLKDGRIELEGSARPLGMSFVYQRFPYRFDQVTGSIDFVNGASARQVRLTGIAGRRGQGEVGVAGVVDFQRKGCFDVTVSGKGLPLDAEMRSALPEKFRAVWDEFSPAGTAGAIVRVWRQAPNEPEQTHVTLALDRGTSMTYRHFPYRLDELSGSVRISEQAVTVDSLSGRHGPMACMVDGTLAGPGGAKGETNLTIEAGPVPLDGDLLAALPSWTRKAVASLHATGQAERVSARLRQSAGQPLDLRVVARLKDAAFRPDAFPYAVQEASGVVTIRPGRVIIEDLSGRRGQTQIAVSGQVLLDPNQPGLDLHVRGSGVEFDEELLAALPAEVQRIWRKLAPGGQADVDFSLQHRLPDHQPPLDYQLVLQARDMHARYQDFPYTLRGIVGRAVVTPDGARLEGLAGTHGQAKLTLQGELKLTAAGEEAHLAVRGADVPIDEELLAALPASVAPLARRFQPGGTCDLDLTSFRISRPLAPGAGASSGPASAPALPAGQALRWSMEGRVAFHAATLDVGLGHKTLSGSLRGTAAQTGDDLAIQAGIELASVQVGRQQLTKLGGRLTKKPGSQLMRLSDLSAHAHGGQVAGFAEIRLVDPLEFGVSLSVDGIQLEDLFRADPNVAGARSKVTGSLTGNVQLTATAGDKPHRQASGALRIYRGELYKLPVMLGLLHVVYLSLPGETAFTDGMLTYHLRDDTLVFDEIYLRGSALSIVGSGTMNMKSEALDLTFLSGPPRKLPRLGSLSELLEGIAREIAQVHVGGTVRKPEMRTVPLRNLDRLVRDLLNPGRSR